MAYGTVLTAAAYKAARADRIAGAGAARVTALRALIQAGADPENPYGA